MGVHVFLLEFFFVSLFSKNYLHLISNIINFFFLRMLVIKS